MTLKMKMRGEQFTEIVTALKMIRDARFRATSEGVSLRAVDPANVAMVDLYLSPSYFESYECKEDTWFAIDAGKYAKVKPRKDDLIEWTVNEHNTEITINNRRTYQFAGIDALTVKWPDAMGAKLKTVVEVEGRDLYEAVQAASTVSEKAYIEYNGDLWIYNNGEDTFNEKMSFTEVHELKESRSLFSLDYLLIVSRYFKDKRKIELSLDQDHPVTITKRNAGQDMHSYIKMILAPRILPD